MTDAMLAPKPVIVGVDGSAASRAALVWAAGEAELRGVPLEAVTAWEYPQSYGWAAPWPAGLDLSADATRALDEAVASALGESAGKVARRVVEGQPRQVLREESRRATTLVVGNRGHSGVAGVLLGSVSEYLAAHAHCPVVIVHAGED